MSDIVGIDLGTTNSLIGIMDAGFPILIADADSARLTPSVVHFPEGGQPLVGSVASRMRAVDPARTVYSIKRFMGRRIDEESDDVGYQLAGKKGAPVRVQNPRRGVFPGTNLRAYFKEIEARCGARAGARNFPRRDHRASVFQRCAAQRNQARGGACGLYRGTHRE